MRKLLVHIGFILLVGISVAYVLPSETFSSDNSFYYFNNFPSPVDKSERDVNIQIPGVTPTYSYSVISKSEVENDAEWNKLVAEDRKTLERRVESFVGTNYELQVTRHERKAKFEIFLLDSLGPNTDILTSTNSTFTVSVVETASATIEGQETPSEPEQTEINLQRSDFGAAEIIPVEDQQNPGQVNFQVRLPVGIVGPSKIDVMNQNIFSQLTIFTGDQEFGGQFQSNQQTSRTVNYLVLGPFQNPDQAAAVATFLNTGSYQLGYELSETRLETRGYGYLYLLAVIVIVFLLCVMYRVLVLKERVLYTVSILLGSLAVIVAATKLLSIDITLGYILILTIVAVFGLLKVKTIYFITLGSILFTLKLLGYLYFFSVSWPALTFLFVASLVLWSIKYVKN